MVIYSFDHLQRIKENGNLMYILTNGPKTVVVLGEAHIPSLQVNANQNPFLQALLKDPSFNIVIEKGLEKSNRCWAH